VSQRGLINVALTAFIHVRLREGRDDDVATWYEAQDDRSEAVREAIRVYMRLQSDNTQEAVIKEAVARELARLPDVVACAVREALASYRLAPVELSREPGAEDPELAARLDAQLDDFFGEIEAAVNVATMATQPQGG
jgi:hypothetical protein